VLGRGVVFHRGFLDSLVFALLAYFFVGFRGRLVLAFRGRVDFRPGRAVGGRVHLARVSRQRPRGRCRERLRHP